MMEPNNVRTTKISIGIKQNTGISMNFVKHFQSINRLTALLLFSSLMLPLPAYANLSYNALLGKATVVTLTTTTFGADIDADTEGFVIKIGTDLAINSSVFATRVDKTANRELENQSYDLSGSFGPFLTSNRITYTPSEDAEAGDTFTVAYGAEACTRTENDCLENEDETRAYYGNITFTITDSTTTGSAASVFDEQVCSTEVFESENTPEYCTTYSQLSDTDKLDALSSVNPEEVNAGSTAVKQQSSAQESNVSSRINALRSGASGISLSGLSYSIEGSEFSGNWLHVIADSIGGTAGADTPQTISPWGFFINGSITDGKRDGNNLERGFKNTANAVTLGTDYRFSRELIGGIAYGINISDINFDDNDDGMKVNTKNLMLYGTWYKNNSNVDMLIGFSHSNIKSDRYIIPSARTAEGDTKSKQTLLSISGGYNWNTGALSYGPSINISYLSGHIDAYKETGGGGLELGLDKQKIGSQTLSLGGNISYAYSVKWGVISPYLRIEWKQELNNQNDAVNGTFISTEGQENFSVQKDGSDNNWYHSGVGIAATFQHGLSAYLDYDSMLSYDDTTLNTLSYGGRWATSF